MNHATVTTAIREAADKLAKIKINNIIGMADCTDYRDMADDLNIVVAHIFLPVLDAMTARINSETGADVQDIVSVVHDQLGDALGRIEGAAIELQEHETEMAIRSRRA